jgi:predicted secreted protein
MAKILGNDYRLFVESPTPGTYNQIGGQGDLSVDRKAGSIDISDKNSAPYGLVAAGNFAVEISLDGIPDLPDANGLARVDTQFKARTATKFQIRNGALGTGADVKFEASCNILDLSINLGKDSGGSYSIRLGLAASPATDTLFVP